MKKISLLLIAATLLFTACFKKEEQATETKRKERPVKLTKITTRDFEDRLVIQGSLEAKYYANVGPKVDGTLTDIRVDVGDRVEAGKTVLFVSDSRKRSQAKDVAEQVYLVAKENYNVSLANITRAQARYDKAKKDCERYTTLFKNGNVTINEKERFDTEYLIADADLKLAKANSQAAKAQTEQAKVAFDVAAKDLEDCTIYAPLSGVVIRRFKEPGEHCGPSAPIVRIEGTEVLEAVANLPGAYYNRIEPNKTNAHIIAEGNDAGNVLITYRADAIDTVLRTFKIKALMKNEQKKLASGMMADMTIIIQKRSGLAVPTHCVIEREQGNVMYGVVDGKAQEILVNVGFANDGFTEILSAKIRKADGSYENTTLSNGAEIISEGQYLIIHGDAVSVTR